MRHRKKVNHLGRKSEHRKAMLSNMAAALILKKRITTTLAKAKALVGYVEPLISKSKVDTTHSRRTVFSYLHNKFAVSELFREIAQKVANRPGGYTRILKTGFRKGDGAEMCLMELVDYNENLFKTTEETQKKTRRGRRGKKSTDTAENASAQIAEIRPKVEKTSGDADQKDTARKEKTDDELSEATVGENVAELDKSEIETLALPENNENPLSKKETAKKKRKSNNR